MARVLNSTSGKTVHGVKYAAAATKQQAPKFIKHQTFQRNPPGYIKR